MPYKCLNLDGFYVLAELVYDPNEQQEELPFLVHKVFGWDDQLQEYSFCLFDAPLSVRHSHCMGIWQGKTLTLYQESPDFCLRYIFQFLGDQLYYPGCLYIVKVEALMDNNEWEAIAEGEYRRSSTRVA